MVIGQKQFSKRSLGESAWDSPLPCPLPSPAGQGRAGQCSAVLACPKRPSGLRRESGACELRLMGLVRGPNPPQPAVTVQEQRQLLLIPTQAASVMPGRPGCGRTRLEGLEGLHELLQLVRRQEVPDEVLASAHLRQLLSPLCQERPVVSGGGLRRSRWPSREPQSHVGNRGLPPTQPAHSPRVLSISMRRSWCSQVPSSLSTSSSLS